MKYSKFLSLLVAFMMLLGSMVGTAALAATTAPAETTVAARAETTEAAEAEQKSSLVQQLPKLLLFGAIVGVLAVIYGFTTMRYNQEKMDDMTEESRRAVEKIQELKEKSEREKR